MLSSSELSFVPFVELNTKNMMNFLSILPRYFANKQNNSCQYMYQLIFSAIYVHDHLLEPGCQNLMDWKIII